MAEAPMLEKLERRRAALWTERTGEWDAHWKDCQKYIEPSLGRFEQHEVNDGDKKRGSVIDETASESLDILVAGLSAGLTSPARPWFRLITPDTDMMEFGPVKAWLHEVEKRMRTIFTASNVYSVLPQSYGELGLFGTDLTFWLRSFNTVVRGVSVTCGEYALALNEEGEVDTTFRVYSPTVEQMVASFGADAVSANVRSMFDRGDYYKRIEVYHGVYRRKEREAGRVDGSNLPFASVYWEKGRQDQPLSVSGFAEKPFTATRWRVTGLDTYGRSPGMKALGNVKQLQFQERRKAQVIDKLVSPPMTGPTALRESGASLVAGGITYVDGIQGSSPAFRPAYQVDSSALPNLAADMEDVRNRVRKAFFADLFLMISQLDNVRSATEVVARQEEKMLMLGPVLERIASEKLNPLIDRAFALMGENGLLPPPPPELEGVDLRVDYVSILAQAQKAVSTTAVERLVGFVGNIAAAKPDVLDKLDEDQAVDEYADMLGVPPSLVRSDDVVAEMRAARQQQQQTQQALAVGREAAETAEVLSRADTRPGNALSALAGVG